MANQRPAWATWDYLQEENNTDNDNDNKEPPAEGKSKEQFDN